MRNFCQEFQNSFKKFYYKNSRWIENLRFLQEIPCFFRLCNVWQHRCFSWSGNLCSRKDLIDKPEQSPFLFCAHPIFIEGWKKAMFSMDKRCCQMWRKSQHPFWILMVTGGTLLHVMNHSFYDFDAALRSGCAQNLFGNITLSKCLCIHLHVVYLNSGL